MKFLRTISVNEFKEILASIDNLSLGAEFVDLNNSFKRVVSQDIHSSIDVPHFTKSRMDGYAVIAEDTFGAEEDNLIRLKLVETIHAGDVPQKKLVSGQCASVATGAPIPEGATGVVMVEFTERSENDVLISKAVTPGTYIISIGHDIKKDDIILKQNTYIDLAALGMLSSCGIKSLKVYRKPRVGLMSSGDEIVSHETDPLPTGKIYDINSVVLGKAIENSGAIVNYYGIIPDNAEELKSSINKGIEENDVLILSGGTSKGEGDISPKVLKEREDVELMVHGVRIKPGKPIIFAKLKNKIMFILPGYPTSALSCFYVFVDDFLRKLAGIPSKEKGSLLLEVGERIYSEMGRHEFKPIEIKEISGTQMIFPIKTGSEAISTIFNSDGYVEVESMEQIIEKGDKRRVYFYS